MGKDKQFLQGMFFAGSLVLFFYMLGDFLVYFNHENWAVVKAYISGFVLAVIVSCFFAALD